MAITRAPRDLISASCARNCATCSRQKIQPQWRRNTTTVGCFAQVSPRHSLLPSTSGNSNGASLLLRVSGIVAFSGNTPDASTTAKPYNSRVPDYTLTGLDQVLTPALAIYADQVDA